MKVHTMATSFKDFLLAKEKNKIPLEEAISQRHMDMADRYDPRIELDRGTKDAMDKAFTHGPHHAVIDLGAHEGFADPDVTEHLRSHGWKIHDYQKGLARQTVQVGAPERGIPLRDKVVHKNIGRILEETNATPNVKSSFANDSERKLKSTGGLKVLITTHPYATVGKTSGTSWSGESCMNADTGAHKHKLYDDSAHGTHEAFLIHPDDSGVHTGYPDNPLARISLKRYDSERSNYSDDNEDEDHESESHTVFRPENRAYGAGTNAFASTVQHWSEQNYPAKQGKTYRKNQDVYDDSGNDSFKALSDNGVKSMLDAMPMGHNSLSQDHLDLAMNHIKSTESVAKKGDQIENAALGIRNLNVEHVHELGDMAHKLAMSDGEGMESGKNAMKSLARMHGDKFSTSLIEKTRLTNARFGLGDVALPTKVISNKKLPMQVVDKLPADRIPEVHESLIKPHHLDKVISAYENNESGSAHPVQKLFHLMNSDHVDRIVKGVRFSLPVMSERMLQNKNFKPEHTEILMKKPSLSHGDKLGMIKTLPGITSQHLQSDTIRGSIDKKAIALSNPHISKELAGEAASYLTSPQVMDHATRMRISEGAGKHFTDEHVENLVNHHINRPNSYGFTEIYDHDLSTRMMHSYGKKIDDETEKHNAADMRGEDYDTDKLDRLHVAHTEHMDAHYDNFFGDKSEDEKANSPEFLKFAEHAQHHHDNDSTGNGYPEKFRNAGSD
jgi:hypothetical protein